MTGEKPAQASGRTRLILSNGEGIRRIGLWAVVAVEPDVKAILDSARDPRHWLDAYPLGRAVAFLASTDLAT